MINQVFILLAQWLRQGLHHQGAGALLHAETVAASLQQAGLCEEWVDWITRELPRPDRVKFPVSVSGNQLSCL